MISGSIRLVALGTCRSPFWPHLRFDIYRGRGRWKRPSPSPSFECWRRAALGRSGSRSASADSWNKLNDQRDTERKTTQLSSYALQQLGGKAKNLLRDEFGEEKYEISTTLRQFVP